jgi:hypothetical protein
MHTPNAERNFLSNADVGASGSSQSQGLEAMRLALSPEALAPSGCNAGFLRRGGGLSVIFISDTPDSSPDTIGVYSRFLREIQKQYNYPEIRVSSIGGPLPQGCASPNGFVAATPRYQTMAQSFGGLVDSLCNLFWGQTLSSLEAITFGYRKRFFLQGIPRPSSLRVFVDGKELLKGFSTWIYLSEGRSIVFQDWSVPSPNSRIEVEYEEACARILP